MPPEQIALILSIASFAGVIIGPIATSLISARQAGIERKEAQRQEYKEYLLGLMNALIRLRSKLQYVQGGSLAWSSPETKAREEAYGEAYAVILSINDSHMRTIVREIMTGQV